MKISRAVLCLIWIVLSCSTSIVAAEAPPRMYKTYALEGSWEEIGRQTALHFRDTIVTTGLVFENVIGVDAEETLAYYEEIKHLIPSEIIEQMQGVALGLNEYWMIPYNMAWRWTLVTNLGFDMMTPHSQGEEVPGCTAFAVHSDAGTFLGHNTDNTEKTLDMGSLIHYLPDNGNNAFLSFFSPAFVGAALAINEKGLALLDNVGGRNKNPMSGLPMLLKTRQVIAECDNLTQAVDSFTDFLKEGGTYGYATCNFLLLDFKDSSMVRLQVCSDEIKVTYGQELKEGVTYLGCTNEFDDDFSPRSAEDLEKTSVISSRARYERLMEILPSFDTYDLETCWKILSDSSGGEPDNDTICRRGENTITTLSNIFTRSTCYYTVGLPCDYLSEYGGPVAVDYDRPVRPSISGTVKAWGRPQARATVILKSVSGEGIDLKAHTDKNGTFVFNNLEEGKYRLWAMKFLHLPRKTTVNVEDAMNSEVAIKLFF